MAKHLIDRTTLMSYLKKIVDKCKETYANKKDTVKNVELVEEINEETETTIKTLKFTFGDDTVKEFDNIGSSGSANIDDTKLSTKRVYSSQKVDDTYLKKEDANSTYLKIADSHVHNGNIGVLDSITEDKITIWNKAKLINTEGEGTTVLTDSGEYKAFTDLSNQINDNATTSTTTTFSANKIMSEISTAINESADEIFTSVNEIRDTKVDKIKGMGLSTNDYTTRDKARIEMLEFEGDGASALFNDGQYYPITNCGIDDEVARATTTYSSEKVESKIKESIDSLVLPTQNDAPTMWQKTYLDVKSGDVLEMTTTTDFIISKTIVQAFKRVNGDKEVIKTINKFNKNEEADFFYNPEEIEFVNENDGMIKIKDNYSIPIKLNNTTQLYESNVIKKSDYVELNGFSIEMR